MLLIQYASRPDTMNVFFVLVAAVVAVWVIYRVAGRKVAIVEYRTVDGGPLAPYPGMTDLELYDFECDMKVRNPTFKSIPRT